MNLQVDGKKAFAYAAAHEFEPGQPTVVFLHGAGLDHSWWGLQSRYFGYHGRNVLALDLPGHGRSDHRPRGNWYHFIDNLADVLARGQERGLERFTLLGHSLGGAIASMLAAAAPSRVEELWLIEALGPMSTEAAKALPVLRQAVAEHAGAGAKTLRIFPSLELAVAARRQATTLSARAAELLGERGTTAVAGGWTWSSDPRVTLTSAMRLTEEQILAYLSGISCPTLLVLADPPPPWLPPSVMAERVKRVPNLSLQRIAGTHHLHLEDPAPVAAAIASFRAGLRAEG